jgi:hypothetical protein
MNAPATQAVAAVLALARNLTPEQEKVYLAEVVVNLAYHLHNAVKVTAR